MKERIARFITSFANLIQKCVLRFRYKIYKEDFELVRQLSKQKEGVLFLVNHTSLLDGPLVGLPLWDYLYASPLVVEDFFYHPAVHWFFVCGKAIPVPDFNSGTYDLKDKELQDTLDQVIQRLKEGGHLYLFPGGKLKSYGYESMHGNSFLFKLFKQYRPQKIVLVRSTGMWGSSLSRSHSSRPDLFKGWGKRIKIILANGIFFLPKRIIRFHFEERPDFPANGSKQEINKFLNEWFNAPYPQGEPPVYCPYYFWEKQGGFKTSEMKHQEFATSKHSVDCIIAEISTLFSIPKETIKPESELGSDLGLDSLDFSQLTYRLEEKFDAKLIVIEELITVNDVAAWLESKSQWLKPLLVKPIITKSKADNLKSVIVGQSFSDLWSTPISRSDLDKKINTLISQIAKIPSKCVGILQLNSIEAMATLEAILACGKIPIVIDWLNTDISFKKRIHESFPLLPILTAKDLFYSLNHIDMDGLDEQLIFIDNFNPPKNLELMNSDHFKDFVGGPLFDFLINENGAALPTSFSDSEVSVLMDKIASFSLSKNDRIAVIHPFSNPREVAISLLLQKQGFSLFFISSYRVNGDEISSYLKDWNIEKAICTPRIFALLENRALPNLQINSF